MQKTGDNCIWYTYDESGNLSGLRVGSSEYYYYRNGQGDIIGIIDGTGSIAAKYSYDAWGNPVAITDGNGNDVSGNAGHIANINPLRYRGYFYDIETGLYYLQSRYYDSQVGRFVNADAQLNTSLGVLGCNMFVYCLNNPISKIDYNGNKPGDLFNTMDEAARDFAFYINKKSINEDVEYASYIYTVEKIVAINIMIPLPRFRWSLRNLGKSYMTISAELTVIKYTYKEPKRGSKSGSSPPINWFKKDNVVARIHTHGAYDSAYRNDNFSSQDQHMAHVKGVPSYVATPGGLLRKYNPVDMSDVILFDDIPYDPSHPMRR